MKNTTKTPKAPKTPKTTNRKPIERFEDRLLSAGKVIRIIKSLGIDPSSFRTAYEKDDSRGRNPKPVTAETLEVVRDYLQHGLTSAECMGRLGIKTSNAFLAMVDRVKEAAEASVKAA